MSNFGLPNVNLSGLLLQARQWMSPNTGTESNSPVIPGGIPGGMGDSGPIFGLNRLPLSMLFGNEAMRLNSEESSLFLKDAMKLPQEVKMLLMFLALESAPNANQLMRMNLRQAIEESLNHLDIPVDEVQALLGKNAKEAAEKLMKLVQVNQMGQTKGAAQIAELATTLSKMSERIQESPVKAMETLILLYIPWQPLVAQQRLELDFEGSDGGGEAGERDISVILFLNTNTLGRFKLAVSQLDPLQLSAKVYHEEIAKPIMPALEQSLNQKLAEDGLPASLFDTAIIRADAALASEASDLETSQSLETSEQTDKNKRKPLPTPQTVPQTHSAKTAAAHAKSEQDLAGFKNATRQENLQHIQVQQGDHVSLLVFNSAYALARMIFEADEHNRRLQYSRQKR